MITSIRKPECRDLLDWEKEFSTQVNKIRYMIEQVEPARAIPAGMASHAARGGLPVAAQHQHVRPDHGGRT